MPIKKSAKKALRQSIKNKMRNSAQKKQLKEIIKKIKTLSSKGDTETAKNLLPNVYKAVDKAAKKGLIKNNNANRKKSRLTNLVLKQLS